MLEILSPYIVAAGLAWLVAQGTKYVIHAVKHRDPKNLKQLYLSGNMPSAHSATVAALVIVVGLKDGVGGPLFALALLFALIVMYDAVMVRRSSGEQGEVLTSLLEEQKSKLAAPRVARGHTPLEVLVGAVLGCLVGIVVFIATK